MVISNNETIKLKATPLKELHVELGARMVPFAGYEMPVNYTDGIKIEEWGADFILDSSTNLSNLLKTLRFS